MGSEILLIYSFSLKLRSLTKTLVQGKLEGTIKRHRPLICYKDSKKKTEKSVIALYNGAKDKRKMP